MKNIKNKKKNFISVVIAAYNEKGNVERLFAKIAEIMKRINAKFEIVGIIDGDDGSYESLQKMKKQKNLSELRLYHSKKPSGLGNAFKKGFNLVSKSASHILTMDADWNHNPEEIPVLISKMKETDADIVIGSRHCEGGQVIGIPLWKKTLSGIMNIFFSIITNVKAKDKTSGYRLYTKEANDFIKNKYTAKNFEFLPEILIIAQRKGLKMVEAPIHFKYRTIGKSKMSIVKTAKGYLRLIFKIFFGN